MSVQAPSAVVLIRPHHFAPNSETADDNVFQTLDAARTLAETDPMVVAGRLEVEAMTLLTPPGTQVVPGIPVTLPE